MGLISTIFGRKRLPQARPDRIAAIAAAELTIRTELDRAPKGVAGLALKPLDASSFSRAKQDVERVLRLAAKDLGGEIEVTTDNHGYMWAIVKDSDFPDVVASIQVASQMISEEGFADQMLCAVFPFESPVLNLVYLFKRGTFYAFSPREGNERDTAEELRTHALLDGEIPLEKDLGRRFPLWDLPF